LYFAVGANIGVNNLVGVKNILPNIEEGVGVSEGKNNKGGVNTKHTLNVFCFLLDVVGVERLIL
jgi:hypothetical protein